MTILSLIETWKPWKVEIIENYVPITDEYRLVPVLKPCVTLQLAVFGNCMRKAGRKVTRALLQYPIHNLTNNLSKLKSEIYCTVDLTVRHPCTHTHSLTHLGPQFATDFPEPARAIFFCKFWIILNHHEMCHQFSPSERTKVKLISIFPIFILKNTNLHFDIECR